jgi:hypothetical protein
MSRDKLHNVDTFGEIIITSDSDWNAGVHEAIEEGVKCGEIPEAAALNAGISRRKFRIWWEVDSFRDWVKGLQLKHYGDIRKKIVSEIEDIEFPTHKAEKLMKYLEHIDPNFSIKNKLEIKEADKSEDADEFDKEFDEVIAAAEKAREGAQAKEGKDESDSG